MQNSQERGPRLRVGISACLLGSEVRYDGGHKLHQFLTDVLARAVEWVPVCPEVEAGFGTPREPMHLARSGKSIRLMTNTTDIDVTRQLDDLAVTRVTQLENEALSGYVLKKDSPSCGLKVAVATLKGVSRQPARGLFAERLLERFPNLPVEEEDRLSSALEAENFLQRATAYARLRDLFRAGWTYASFVAFHTSYKLVLMAHSPTAYQALGRFVASARRRARDEVESTYSALFMSALETPATRSRHVNVLQHMAGYLKNVLEKERKAELIGTIESFRRGRVALDVPVMLLREHVRRHGVTYLAGQRYLDDYCGSLPSPIPTMR